MDTSHNFFELFRLPQRFDLDVDALTAAWKQAQWRVHPDRFVQASATEKRIAAQWAAHINEAYDVLKCHLKRARYMCELAGFSIDAEQNTRMSIDFLEQQMAWRESLSELQQTSNLSALSELRSELTVEKNARFSLLSQAFSAQPYLYEQAVLTIREWMFIQKFSDEVEALFVHLSTLNSK